MHVLGIHHVAFAHAAGDAVDAICGLLGAEVSHVEAAEGFVERMVTVGDAALQLLEPTGPGVVSRFVARRGAALHHVAFEVDDVDAAVSELEGRGVAMVGEAPRPGGAGTRIAFVQPGATGGLLVELVQGAPSD